MSKAHHTRSVSLPSSLHPVSASFESFDEVLSTFKASDDGSAFSICESLSGVQSLHQSVDDLILVPENQQALWPLSRVYNEKHDDIFDGSIRALDLCGVAKEILSGAKGCVHELQSVLRRRVGEANLAKEIKEYMTQRRNARKSVLKAMGYSTSKHNATRDIQSSVSIVGMLKQVDTASVSVIESLLTFILGSKGPAPTKWSLVSKLMQSTRITCEEPTANELSKVDTMLQMLLSQKTINVIEMQNLQTKLTDLEFSIRDLEEGVEILFRRLIKTRVSLLNTLNH